MDKNLWTKALTAVGLILCAAWVLAHRDSFQRLGAPGVKLVPIPSYDSSGSVVMSNSIALPERVLDYVGTNMPISDIVLGWLPGDTTYGQRMYVAPDGFWAQMNGVLMGTDRTSIHKPQYCLTGVGWEIIETTKTMIPVSDPYPYELPVIRMTARRLMKLENGRTQELAATFVYWFVADGHVTAEHSARMVGILKDLPKGVLQRWAYVSCFAVSFPGEEDQTFERLSELIAASVPEFQLATGPMKEAGLR